MKKEEQRDKFRVFRLQWNIGRLCLIEASRLNKAKAIALVDILFAVSHFWIAGRF